VVRRAYQFAEGSVDVQRWVDLFADDEGVKVTGMSLCGERLGSLAGHSATMAHDIHGELHKMVVQDNIVAVELSIRGTFTGPFESPAGVLRPDGAKLDVPRR
jgi:hypothetical protein